jgi:hypothetical protein
MLKDKIFQKNIPKYSFFSLTKKQFFGMEKNISENFNILQTNSIMFHAIRALA